MEYSATSIDPDDNRSRFYHMTIEKALFFDEYLLTCTWGRIGTTGRTQTACYGTYEECLKMADKIKKMRLKHGYQEE